MMKTSVIKTQENKNLSCTKDFHELGLTIVDWARERQFSIRLVYSILRGERKCLRGQSYQIAKELGMK